MASFKRTCFLLGYEAVCFPRESKGTFGLPPVVRDQPCRDPPEADLSASEAQCEARHDQEDPYWIRVEGWAMYGDVTRGMEAVDLYAELPDMRQGCIESEQELGSFHT